MIVDLALPHDVEPAAGDLPDVSLINLATLSEELRDTDGEVAVSPASARSSPRSWPRTSPPTAPPA